MKIALGADHAGFELKERLKKFLESEGHEVIDFGPNTLEPADDYPDFIAPAARAVAERTADRAIVMGGSGQGEGMVANRIRGVRAVVYYGGNNEIIRLSRDHNDTNVLALGARFVDGDEAERVARLWLATPFSEDERHTRRLAKLD